ncbi:MAG: rhomboid family intramembrane serine protease [Propionivibrio sp.]
MLIVPVSRRPDWRNPPLITLALIVINCLIFFGWQSGDEAKLDRAYRFYVGSTLPQTEFPRYIAHLEQKGRDEEAASAQQALNDNEPLAVLQAMESDDAFMKALRGGRIVTPDDAGYAGWRKQRDAFDRLQHATSVERLGFRPAAPTVQALFGHMFLHGGFDHLLGNMAILFIVGIAVEETLGRRRYLAFYLLAGLGAGVFDLVFNAGRMAPGIGASGAISGVMAMFVALYGLRRIRFFYWVLVYFDFFRAPALIVLPWWIANELYQYLFNQESMVNYMAHLGGFVTGALLIAAQRRFGKRRVVAVEQETPIDPLPGELARIDALLGALRIDEAVQALRRLAAKHPHDLAVVLRYYKVARNAPASDDYHRAAALLFALPESTPGGDELLHETFVEYLKVARPTVRFSARQLITLIRRLARCGHADDAERLTRVLARRAPQTEQLPDLLLLVAVAFRRAGNAPMCEATLGRLRTEFPESEAARHSALAAR